MKKVNVKKSKIHGNGLFANEPIKRGDTIGVAHQVINTSNHKLFIPTGIVGKNYNHSKNNPTAENVIDGDKRYLVALKDLKPGTEITTNYFNTPDMEQPKQEWEDKLGDGGEPISCPEGYYYDPVKGCVPGDEHQKWLREWFADRQMNNPEGQKILEKVRSEVLERSQEFPPYVMTDELPEDTPAAYDTDKNVVLLNKFLPEKMLEESKTHENTHYLTSGDKFLNLFDKEIGYVINQNIIDSPKKINTGNEKWDKTLKENFDYAVSPEEMYSKIMTLRKDAGFDPTKPVTLEDLNNYFTKVKDSGNPLNPDIEELKAVTKDKQSIVNLLNDLVYQTPTNQDIQITKRGGSIKRFNPGGIVNDLPQNVGISYLPEDGRSFYDPLSDTINLNPNANDDELNHELVHAWQNRTGRLRTNPNLPQQRPPIVASDEQAASYYTRKGDDVDYYLNNLPTLYPDLTGGNIWTEDLNRFIPDQIKYDKVIDPLMYLDPNTMEGEAEMFSQVYGPPPGIGFRQKGGSNRRLKKKNNGGPSNPDYPEITTYEFETLTPEEIAARDKSQQECTEDQPCYETDQIQAIYDKADDIPKAVSRFELDLVDELWTDPKTGKSREYIQPGKPGMDARELWKKHGIKNFVEPSCMYVAGLGWRCAPETKDYMSNFNPMHFNSNAGFINAVDKGYVPFTRIGKFSESNFDDPKKGNLKIGDVVNFKGSDNSHAMTFMGYDENNKSIWFDSNGMPAHIDIHNIWEDLLPNNSGKGRDYAYVNRFDKDRYIKEVYGNQIKELEEKARTNPTYYNKGGSIDAAFQKKLEEVAKRLKVKPSDLLGIMKHESGLKASAVNPYTGATGLIQFMPATAKRMGTSVEALKNMSALEQLDYVEKFYKPITGKAKDIGDLYMFTFLPAAVGKPDDFVLGARGSNDKLFGINKNALYIQNKGFDKDNKGYYTVGDVKARIAKFSGSKIKINEDKPEQTGVPIEEYSEVTYNPVEQQQPKRPQYTLEQAMFEMGALDQPTSNSSKVAQALKYLAPKRFSPRDIQTYLNNEEIKQYVKGGYIVEELDEFDKGGLFNRKKNQPPPQVTHTAIDPAYLEEHPDFASSIQNMPEVVTSYTRKRDKWGRPEGDPYYQYDKKKKGWIDDQGRSYRPQWKIDEDIKRKEENKSWGQRFGDWINQDVLGYPSDKELSKQMAKAKPKVFVDPSGKKHTGHGAWDNYGDAGVQMVYPEAYVMGPGAGVAGGAKQGINAIMEGVAATNKFALNDLLSAGVRSTLSPLEKQIAEKATVENLLGAYGAADAVVNNVPKLAGDISSMVTQGYSGDKALDALKQTADITSSFMGYTPLANAKNLNKAKDIYSLSKGTVSNLEDPTNLKDQYSFYEDLGKLSGIKKKGGFLKRKRKKQETEPVEPLTILQPGEELFPLPTPEEKELYYEPISLKEMSPEELEAYKKSVAEEQERLKYESDKAAQPGYFDEAKQWVEDWHNSPMYNQMILNSNWGQQKNADYQTKLRKKNIQTIPSLNVVEKSADKEGSKLPSTMSTAAHSLSDTGQIEVFPEGYNYGPSLFIHEILHSSDRPRELYKWNHPSYYTGKVFDEYSPNNITSEEFDKVVGKNDSYSIDYDRNGEILDYPDWMIYKDPRFPNEDPVWHDRVMPNKDQMYITTHRGSNWKDNEKYKLNKENGFFKIKTDKEVEEGLSWLDKSDPDYKEFFLLEKNFPYEMIKAGKKDWKEFGHNYVSDPTEVRARLGEIRYNAQKEGIYDPFTQQITPEIFQNYINKERDSDHWQPMKPIDELREDYTDEEILWMLQNISKNKSEQDDQNELQYGEYGGQLELGDEVDEATMQQLKKLGFTFEKI